MDNGFGEFAVGPVVERIDDHDGQIWEVIVDHQLERPQSSKVSLYVLDADAYYDFADPDSKAYVLVPNLAHEVLSDAALVEQGVWKAVDSLDVESLGATSIVHEDREHWIVTAGASFSPAAFVAAVCKALYADELGRRIHACLKRDLDEHHAWLLAHEAATPRRFIEQVGQATAELAAEERPSSVTASTVLGLIERASRWANSLRLTIADGWNRASSVEGEERDEIIARTTAKQRHLDELERELLALIAAYESAFGEPPTWKPIPLEVTFRSVPLGIRVIKIVRTVTGLGLEEAKQLIANVGAGNPETVVARLTPAKAREVQRELSELGGELSFRAV